MAHKQIIYSYPRFIQKWYRLDAADVSQVRRLLRSVYDNAPEEYKQSILNVYNDLAVSYNPRNLKLVRGNE